MQTIIKRGKTADYTIISNTATRDSRLSWKAKGLLAYIMGLPEDWKINIADLATKSKDGRDATAKALNELIEMGYAVRKRLIGENGRFEGYCYTVTDIPETDITADGSQTAVHSAVGKLDIGKGSRIVDPAGTLGQALADAEGIQLELFIVRFAGRGVRNGFTVGNYRAAAFGFFFQIRSHLRSHMTFGGDHAGARRRGNDPVFQSQVPDPDRGKKVRVQFLTRVFLGHDRSSSIHVSNRTYCLLVHYRKTASAM